MMRLLGKTACWRGWTVVVLLLVLRTGAQAAWAQTYTTNFPNTENPISEGGNWINGQAVGIDWGNISTTPGQTHDHSGAARYADATALLTGTWGPDQTAEATVYVGSVSGAPEVELRLRSSLSPHVCNGYEITNSVSGGSNGSYLIIVRWNGPLANFTYLANLSGSQYAVTTGDVVKATIVGNVITSYKNGVQMAQVTDNTYSTGNPGMGFNEGTNGTYGFTNYTATGSGAATAPTISTPPASQTVTAGQTATFSVTASGTAPLSYQWQRSNDGGATWTNVGSNATSYTTSATTAGDNGAHFRVIVTNSAGSVTSSSATLTVNAPGGGSLPSPWQDADVGSPGVSGSATDSSGTFTVIGSGADIWGTSDQFNFAYQTRTGDGEIVARVAGLGNTNGWAKAGVMIRETLNPSSTYAFTALTPANGAVFQRRTTTGGSATSTSGPLVTVPQWVRLDRVGNTFTSYVSPDGVNWTLIGFDTIPMAATVWVGFAVASHDNTVATTAVFDSLSGGGWQPVPPPPTGGAVSSSGGAVSTSGGGSHSGCGATGLEAVGLLALLLGVAKATRARGMRPDSDSKPRT